MKFLNHMLEVLGFYNQLYYGGIQQLRGQNFANFCPPPHCTEIDFASSFGAVLVKMIDLPKTESRDIFGIILGQGNSQKLYLLPKSC